MSPWQFVKAMYNYTSLFDTGQSKKNTVHITCYKTKH